MQRLSRTLRLFQMLALIRKTSFFFFVLLIVQACVDSPRDTESEVPEEKLPDLNSSDFRWVKFENFQMPCAKKMSPSRNGFREIYQANNLHDEVHLGVESYPLSEFQKDSQFPKVLEKQLKWFAQNYTKRTQEQMKSAKMGALKKVVVDKKACFKQEITGSSYGYPKEQTIFLRFYQLGSQFLVVRCWTISSNAEAFRPLATYMGMQLKIKK